MNANWQNYKKLELIAEHVPEPQVHGLAFLSRFRLSLQSFCPSLADTLTQQQQVDLLSRCWDLEGSEARLPALLKAWQVMWNFLNQPIFQNHQSAFPEPEIHCIADESGQLWWYAYDPMTGQNTYLESEEEARVWLEERSYP